MKMEKIKKVTFLYYVNGSNGVIFILIPETMKDNDIFLTAREELIDQKGIDFLKGKSCVWEIIEEKLI